jgi:hypothetical protein
MTDVSRDPAASLGSGAKCRPIGAYVHTPTYDDLLAEIERLRLTDAEREAILLAVACAEDGVALSTEAVGVRVAATLRGLLERLG